MAYKVYLGEYMLPYAPASLELKINNQNETINLINEGEVNILKSAGLTEVDFTFTVPANKYSFVQNYKQDVSFWLSVLETFKTSQQPFQFIVYRETFSGQSAFSTNMKVSLEEYTIKEDADNGRDIEIEVQLLQYREFSTKRLNVTNTTDANGKVTVVASDRSTSDKISSKTYTVTKDDEGTQTATPSYSDGRTLFEIAKQELGNSMYALDIYKLNADTIKKAAKESKGMKDYQILYTNHILVAGTVLNLPEVG